MQRPSPADPGYVGGQMRAMDAIADAFDQSRSAPWGPVVEFLATLPVGSSVLDAGGGNGRHARVAAARGLVATVVDVSGGLLRHARRHAERDDVANDPSIAALQGDLTRLPLADATFDHAVAVASVHCIAGRAARRAALAQLARVVRPGGMLLASVWARDQPRFRHVVADQEARTDQETLAANEEPGDVWVPWRFGVETEVVRFFHLYTLGELVEDLVAAGLEVAATEAVALGGRHLDNLVAVARVPNARSR